MFWYCTIFFGSLVISPILTEDNVTEHQKLLPFSQLAHGLRSGPITILDPKTIFIQDLYYDGKGPDAHFWVGNGSWPSTNGTLVLDENGSAETLNPYNGTNVTITLPSNVSVGEFDYLAVWCIKFKHNFGHTYLKKKTSGGSFGVSLEPLTEVTHGVRSGPIVAVDQKTFFVPNLYYDGEGGDVHFWVGNGTEPSPSGTLVFEETGSNKALPKYQGQSIYVTLPHKVTINDTEHFGIWSKTENRNLGHILIPKGAKIPAVNGNPLFTFEDKEIIRVKKCCQIDQVLQPNGCSSDNHKFNLTVTVRERTDLYALKNLEFVPFVQPISCKHKTYPLDPKEDVFSLLKNGSLAILNPNQMRSMDEYCFETVNLRDEDKDRWVTTAFLCLDSASASISNSAFVLYGVGIVLSAIFLILTALVFLFVKGVFNARDKCIVFYTSSMSVVFVCLIVTQFSELNEDTCVITAYVLQFFLVSSFTWLTLISTETLFKILYYNTNAYTQDQNRFSLYLSVGGFLTMLTFGVSILTDQLPDIPAIVLKQQYGHNECWFADNETIYYCLPIAFAIFCNFVLGVTMRVVLTKYGREHRREIAWITFRDDLKTMFQSCSLLFILMALCWITEIVSIIVDSGETVWLAVDIVNSLQGLLVFIIFVGHPSASGKFCKKKRPIQTKYEAEETPLGLHVNNDLVNSNT